MDAVPRCCVAEHPRALRARLHLPCERFTRVALGAGDRHVGSGGSRAQPRGPVQGCSGEQHDLGREVEQVGWCASLVMPHMRPAMASENSVLDGKSAILAVTDLAALCVLAARRDDRRRPRKGLRTATILRAAWRAPRFRVAQCPFPAGLSTSHGCLVHEGRANRGSASRPWDRGGPPTDRDPRGEPLLKMTGVGRAPAVRFRDGHGERQTPGVRLPQQAQTTPRGRHPIRPARLRTPQNHRRGLAQNLARDPVTCSTGHSLGSRFEIWQRR
jgi:hypothetical protein